MTALSQTDADPVRFNVLEESAWLFYPTTSDVQRQDYVCFERALRFGEKNNPRIILDAALMAEQKKFRLKGQ